MPYVSRNENGDIIELHDSPTKQDNQWLEANSPEILTFIQQLNTQGDTKQALTGSDSDMVRVVEDLIDLLMERQIFTFTELPEPVQAKLNARKQLRKDLNSLEGLINDDDSIF